MPKTPLISVTMCIKQISFFKDMWKRFLIEKYYHLFLNLFVMLFKCNHQSFGHTK